MGLLIEKAKAILIKFKHAFSGLWLGFSRDHSIQLQGCLAIAAIFYFSWLQITLSEWLWVISAIAAVLVLEFINSCLELICNLISKEYNPMIKTIKDMGSAFVLLGAGYAVIIALIISYSHFI